MSWERENIEAAAAYLREMIEAGTNDVRTLSIYEGLLDVLTPARHTTRSQRADAAAAVLRDARDRRSRIDRRGHTDRRLINLGPAAGGERRSGRDRRAGGDRRSR